MSPNLRRQLFFGFWFVRITSSGFFIVQILLFRIIVKSALISLINKGMLQLYWNVEDFMIIWNRNKQFPTAPIIKIANIIFIQLSSHFTWWTIIENIFSFDFIEYKNKEEQEKKMKLNFARNYHLCYILKASFKKVNFVVVANQRYLSWKFG